MAKKKATPKKGALKTAKLEKAETKTEKPKKAGPKIRPKLVLARKNKPTPKRCAKKEPIVEPTVPPSKNEKAVRDYDGSPQREERIRMHTLT